MTRPTADPAALTPRQARARFAAGAGGPTAGYCRGRAQANLIAVPRALAFDVLLFAQRNPKSCPVLDVSEPGERATAIFPGDLATELPGYRVYEHGVCVAEPSEVAAWWRDDLVAFLIGCSFTFEAALRDAGIPLRHIEAGTNVPMYRTNVACRPAGRLSGPMVVSMRPVPAARVADAVRITSRYPAVHGAPVHVGDPAALGIADLDAPDFGDPVAVHPGEIPVFWACGVTPQAAVMASSPEFAIGHAPGGMAVTDAADGAYQIP